MEIVASLIIYSVIIGFWSYVTYLMVSSRIFKESRFLQFGLSIVWISLIFNIIYTGVLGWNFTPVSDLEKLLDSITFATGMVGVVLLYIGSYKAQRR